MLLVALALGLVTTVANILGSYLAILRRRPSREFMTGSIGFGGGFLLASALLEMVPESIERGSWTATFVALGYLIVYLTEQLSSVHLHQLPASNDDHAEDHPPNPPLVQVARTTGIATVVAFNMHDFIDGLAIGSGFATGQTLGVLVFLAVLFHELPAGFVIANILLASGSSRTGALLGGVSLGLITLPGIVIPFWLGQFNPSITTALLALSAGTFIYMGASILIPVVETGRVKRGFLYVVLGFAVFYAGSALAKVSP